jgi:hypothetical protein
VVRLNKGAQKVKAISGSSEQSLIFRGSVAFCLKDVQRGAMRATVEEFRRKLNESVQGSDNFVTSIYNNKVQNTAFPQLSREFYKTLEQARRSFSCCAHSCAISQSVHCRQCVVA